LVEEGLTKSWGGEVARVVGIALEWGGSCLLGWKALEVIGPWGAVPMVFAVLLAGAATLSILKIPPTK